MKIFENEEKWLTNVSEEPDMINTILDNGRSLRQLSLLNVKYVKFRLMANQDLFLGRSSIRDGDSGTCRIKWRTDARDSPNLMLERA